MRQPPPKKCIFCGKGPTTKEDVWPTWLTKYIPRSIPRYTAAVSIINEAGKIVTTRKQVDGDPRSRRAKCVCAKCNNGWMSDLQNKSKSIVLALANGETLTLSPTHQELLSAWITMGTITSEYFNPSRVAISDADRNHFWKTKATPVQNWKIWIGDYHRQN